VKKPALTIRMGAAHWDVTIHAAYDPVRNGDTVLNLRRMDKDAQRKTIFEIVRACREAGRVVT
jgi:hypothetical protein